MCTSFAAIAVTKTHYDIYLEYMHFFYKLPSIYFDWNLQSDLFLMKEKKALERTYTVFFFFLVQFTLPTLKWTNKSPYSEVCLVNFWCSRHGFFQRGLLSGPTEEFVCIQIIIWLLFRSDTTLLNKKIESDFLFTKEN